MLFNLECLACLLHFQTDDNVQILSFGGCLFVIFAILVELRSIRILYVVSFVARICLAINAFVNESSVALVQHIILAAQINHRTRLTALRDHKERRDVRSLGHAGIVCTKRWRDVNNTRTIFCGYVIAQNHAETKFFEFHKLVMGHFKHSIGISLSIFLDKIRCRVCQLFCRFHPRHQLRITHALKFMTLMAANDAIRNHLVAGLVVFQRKFCAFNLEVGRQAVGREHNSDRLCRIWIVSTNRYVFK